MDKCRFFKDVNLFPKRDFPCPVVGMMRISKVFFPTFLSISSSIRMSLWTSRFHVGFKETVVKICTLFFTTFITPSTHPQPLQYSNTLPREVCPWHCHWEEHVPAFKWLTGERDCEPLLSTISHHATEKELLFS